MIIGIDASRAFVEQATGTEYYSRNLIRALVAGKSDARFRLYTRGESLPEYNGHANVEIRPLKFSHLWTHLRLSFEMLMDSPDRLFIPAHVIPPIHPRASFVTVHDLGYMYFPMAHRILDRLYLDLSTRWNVRIARKIFVDSLATRRDLEDLYRVPSDKIAVAYPGIDSTMTPVPRQSDIRSQYGLADGYLLAVGTIHPRKNYARLIEAFSKSSGSWLLVIVGHKGWLYEEIFKRVEKYDLQARVRFLDYVPREDLSALYANSNAFVFPSLYEGFGMPVLEAMACGTPVACSSSSSLPEVGGDAALYFDPMDIKGMREAIDQVMQNEALRNQLRARGFENVKRFSWKECARVVMEGIS